MLSFLSCSVSWTIPDKQKFYEINPSFDGYPLQKVALSLFFPFHEQRIKNFERS